MHRPTDIPKLRITPLREHPEFAPTICQWIFEYWGRLNPDMTPANIKKLIDWRMNEESYPMTFVAFQGSTPIGTSSLKYNEMHAEEQFIHWLGDIVVAPDYRNRGIGSRLVQVAEEAGRRANLNDLYLCTPDRAAMYARLGWESVKAIYRDGRKVEIMRRTLTNAKTTSI